ncbi:MAG: hypothetical protein B9S34_10000 [Opitutia bacterium Tous-C1TDCM]|nr:MAG: hypothetical protein B9S34_10000 [Opitutae bacterium Tous-C1TDCM]
MSATLFLAAAAAAQDPMMAPAKTAPLTPAAKAAARAAELLQRYDRNGDGKIDEDERADAKESMIKEQVDRQMARQALAQATPEQLRQRVLELFDADRDGRLDETERATAEKAAAERAADPAAPVALLREELMKRFDANTNGRLEPEERAAVRDFLAARREAAAETATPSGAPSPAVKPAAGAESPLLARAELLKRFDRNADGRIDAAERETLETTLRSEWSTHPGFLRRWDANSDGKIDDAEWTAAREEQRRRFRAEETK